MLALVFVQAFDLHVEQGVGRDLQAALGPDDGREVHLVGALDGHEFLLKGGRARELFKAVQQIEVAHPGNGAELLGDECGETRVALEQPAAGGDAVGLVLEFPWVERVKFGKEILFEQFRVQRGHAVDRVRAHHGQVGHAHLLVSVLLDERADAFLLIVARPILLHRQEQLGVDVVDKLEVAGQQALKQADTPLLERLGQQGVVRIGKGRTDDHPRGGECHVVLVDEDAGELHDCDGRVRVVELHRDLVCEILPAVGRVAEMAADDVAQRAGDEEILLHQAQLPAGLRLVIRVKHLGNGFADGFLADGFHITAAVECREIEVLR